MIHKITIINFKAFQNVQLGFTELNILTGVNGIGKSTVLQAMLLLRQSMISQKELITGLSLNGKLVNIGRGAEAQNIQANDDTISFEIVFDGKENYLNVQFKFQPDSDFQACISNELSGNVMTQALFTNGHFQYLHANRIGPKITFPASYHEVDQLKSIGNEGEYAVHFLAHYQRKLVELPSTWLLSDSNTLLSQVEAWLNCISKGVRLNSTYRGDLNLATLTYQFVAGENVTPEFTPLNVGFGFTYALPVILSILAASPGDLLLIENPESHLHPHGQAVLGDLMSRAASDGVQLIVETHSDHILNGIRVSVKEKRINPEQVSVYFFERDPNSEEHITEITQPKIDINGRLSRQPKGFFDEYAQQLNLLLQ